MPSLPDTAVIIFLGLLLFGPKGLAQIARQLGKLMGEFRRASNEFRMQMEEELRISEQADRQKEIAAIEAAAPATPALTSAHADEAVGDHMSLPPADDAAGTGDTVAGPLPIASSGELSIMPPATGLPAPRSSSLSFDVPPFEAPPSESASLSSLIESVPKMDAATEAQGAANGTRESAHSAAIGEDQRPMRYTDHDAASGNGHHSIAEESLHG